MWLKDAAAGAGLILFMIAAFVFATHGAALIHVLETSDWVQTARWWR